MSVKTEQLAHSLDELDFHLKKLEGYPRDRPHLPTLTVRELMSEICGSTRDCIVIIASILSENQ